MDYAISVFNAWACGLITVALLWAILSRRVRDGVVVKAGLILMSLGHATIALRFADMWVTDALRMDRAILLINAGLLLVLLGYFLRSRSIRHGARRLTDWTDFDSLPRN